MSVEHIDAPSHRAPALEFPEVWRAEPDEWRGWVVRGLFAAQVRDRLDRLEREHRERGTALLALDPTVDSFDAQPLARVVETYLHQVTRQLTPSDEVLRLARLLFGTEHAGTVPAGAGQVEASSYTQPQRDRLLARLWTLLARHVSATLIVLHADRLSDSATSRLSDFVGRIFSDPIACLAPQVASELKVGGTVVFVGQPRGLELDLEALGFETVDAQAQAPSELRAYLGQPEVLERLVKSTAGSLSRLRALLDELPDNVEELLMHRFEQLDAEERGVLETLALACEPLPAGRFDAASVRGVVDQGFVRRRIDGTQVLLFIDEPGFRSRLGHQIGAARRAQIHRQLSEWCRDAGDRPRALYHRLHAEDAASAVDEAVEVAADLLECGELDEARRLLEAAEPAARGDAVNGVARGWVELERAAGSPAQALVRLEDVLRHRGGSASAKLEALRGELLLATGDHGAATRAFSAAAQELPSARIGLAEALYLAGEQAKAAALAEELLAKIEAEEVERRDEIVRLHNVCGKLAIFDEDLDAARRHFERVSDLAGRWGMAAAMCRGQANLGIVAMQAGENEAARRWLEQAADNGRGNPAVDRGAVLLNLGMLEQRQGRFEAAFERYIEAVECADQAQSVAVYYTAAYNLATLYQDVGAFERALTSLAHIEGEPLGAPPLRILAWVVTARAGVYFEQGEYRRALEAIERARETFEDVDELALHGTKERLQAAIAHIELNQDEAAREILAQIECPAGGRNAGLFLLADAHLRGRQGELADARRLAREAMSELERAGYHHGYCRAAAMLVSLDEEAGRIEDARAVLGEATRKIHGRAEAVPSHFRDAYFEQPVHRRLLGWARTLESAKADEARADALSLPSSRVLAIAHEILEGNTSLREQQRRLEHECIRAALERTEGNITRAAELLQLNRSRLSQIVNADKELSALKERLKG